MNSGARDNLHINLALGRYIGWEFCLRRVRSTFLRNRYSRISRSELKLLGPSFTRPVTKHPEFRTTTLTPSCFLIPDFEFKWLGYICDRLDAMTIGVVRVCARCTLHNSQLRFRKQARLPNPFYTLSVTWPRSRLNSRVPRIQDSKLTITAPSSPHYVLTSLLAKLKCLSLGVL
ncbi:hypothetical protein EDD22DRAFT_266943 [Suillus occidentalis]|nr:hypothetical protein EDD22DRAFT_266943 [Suillus occidentalis]